MPPITRAEKLSPNSAFCRVLYEFFSISKAVGSQAKPFDWQCVLNLAKVESGSESLLGVEIETNRDPDLF